jgi:hypothetical protein
VDPFLAYPYVVEALLSGQGLNYQLLQDFVQGADCRYRTTCQYNTSHAWVGDVHRSDPCLGHVRIHLDADAYENAGDVEAAISGRYVYAAERRCDTCLANRQVVCELTYAEMPMYIIVSVERGLKGDESVKQKNPVIPPITVTIPATKKSVTRYNLTGVAFHKGSTARVGHYTGLVRQAITDQWWTHDDANTAMMVGGTPEVEACVRKESSDTALMFYARVEGAHLFLLSDPTTTLLVTHTCHDINAINVHSVLVGETPELVTPPKPVCARPNHCKALFVCVQIW